MKKTSMILTKTISIIVLAFVLSTPLKATDAITILTWNISVPFENSKEFSQDTKSFLGATLEYRMFAHTNVSLGAYVGWHVFNGETTRTIHVDTKGGEGLKADISGKQFRYINSFPLMLNLNFYIGNPNGAQAYLGLGAGTMIIEERVELGIVAAKHWRWHIALAPEIGFKIPLGYNFHGLASVKYHHAFPAKRITGEKLSHSYISLNIGFVWDHHFYF
ncbi:MAG: hypothetical protein JSV17_18530 [Candidatus Aminicenantes bacterium]|nr:MAG: hypothetical protein JSV17_18530 [Candidatus Aminicenantes bacterium]